MFIELSHSNHSSKWMVPSLSCKDTDTCIACLLDVLSNISLSQVQKQMSLDIFNSLVKNSVITNQLLTTNQDICYYILNLITDFYMEEPHRLTSISLCAEMVLRLEDESLYNLLLDKFQKTVLDMCNEKRTQFCLLVLDQLCSVSLMYAKILLLSQNTINHLLSYQEHMEMDTANCLASLLTHVIKAISSRSEQFLIETDSFVWTIMVTLVFWLNTTENKNLQANCLALLKECLQLEDVSSGLLLVGQNSQPSSHSLLMGLKRMLLTKDEGLVFAGTQCLTRLMENLSETEYIREFFETDLAEFVFELLHTCDNSKLDCVFQCLHTMAGHDLFFDRCHSIYGLDSTLLATQEALDNGRSVIAEKGILFLSCLMNGQPECMPLFVSLSWSKCFEILNACLQHPKLSLFMATLSATKSFLRVQHQQRPVDVVSVTTLLRTSLVQSDHHLKMQSEHSHEQQSFSIVILLLDIVHNNVGLINSDDVLCGNMEEQIQELKTVIRDISGKLILPWMLEHWNCFTESSRVEKFLACLDVLVSADAQVQQVAELAHMVATGLPYQILSLPLQSCISDETRKLIGHVLTGLFLQLAKYVKPSLELSEEILIAGFSRLTWHDFLPGKKGAEKIKSREEAVAWFCLAYFSCLMGYRAWSLLDIHIFLERILQRYPDLLSYDGIVTRAFVYLQAICQTSHVDDESTWCKETELTLLCHLNKSTVHVWLTEDPVVFRWSMLTEARSNSIGEMLLEHWLLQLAAAVSSHGLEIHTLAGDMKDILLEMRHNSNFLHCLVTHLNNHAVASLARDVLIYCISSLTDNDDTDPYHLTLCGKLFLEVTQKFETLFVQTAELNAGLLVNMLSVLCELLERPSLSAVKMKSCFKSVYHAVKLASTCDRRYGTLAWILKYLTCMIRSMSIHDSKTVTAALMTDEKFMETLEGSMASCETGISAPAVSLVAWLAAAEHQYQASRPIIVTSHFLLSSLASCRYATSLHVLKLLNAALYINPAYAQNSGRCVQFVKRQQNFESTSRVFSLRELKQVYLYLQQFIVKEDANLQSQAIECMKTLLNTHPEIRHHAQLQPWNSLMLESVLTARIQSGLTDSELDLCMLFIPSIEWTWMENVGNCFLLALLSGLNKSQLDKARAIFRHIRQLPDACDPEVLAAADEYLRQHESAN